MKLAELFGTELPIVQAPMAGAQGSALTVAVSNAGALGSLPGAMLDAQALRAELAAIRAATDKPFNVNFFCHREPPPASDGDARWRARLAPYFREFGLESNAQAPALARKPFSVATAGLLAAFRPAVVSFHFGLPHGELLARVRAWGARIIATATTVQEAIWLQAQGVDAIIAQGLEAGGHRGCFIDCEMSRQLGTFALLPQIAGAVTVPVIAAGGIADRRGVAAALALGAAGVQVGTAFLFCPESSLGPLQRAALSSDAARHTAVTNVFTGRPARGIVNRLVRELGPMADDVPAFPRAAALLAPLRAAAEGRGTSDFSPLWAGQNASACRVLPAAALVRELAAGLR